MSLSSLVHNSANFKWLLNESQHKNQVSQISIPSFWRVVQIASLEEGSHLTAEDKDATQESSTHCDASL